ncbi:MAG: enoyl-CoA hydratase/isomerase family protein [Pseudomonadota bacterium]
MSDAQILVSREGAVMTVTFNTPAKRNAISTAGLDRLDALADEITADPDVRAVILTGAGDKAFTSGFDLGELGDFKPENFLRSRFSDVFEKWAKMPAPLIGALNGHCMGGGVHVAVACDALVAAPGVRFMIPAARFGFVYVPASIRRIAAALGPSRAAGLLYLNREYVAEDLAPQGFIDCITEDVPGAAQEIAARAAALAPKAVAAMKEIVREAPDPARIDALVRGCAYSEDVAEGLSAMREKRQPVFKNR